MVSSISHVLIVSPLSFAQLFMAAVGLVFAPLAPLVALAAALVFWLGSWVYKYQLMFVFVTKVETGGVSRFCLEFLCRRELTGRRRQRLWNVIINRLLACAILMQALMVLSA
jgi:calcium permeable stress-gated cation channel